MSVATHPSLRLAGRSFLAFVLEPSRPVGKWLSALDEVALQSLGFFANRPVVLNLSGISVNKVETAAILDALTARAIRVISVEGIDPTWTHPSLAPLAGGMESTKTIDLLRRTEKHEGTETPAEIRDAVSEVIDKPVRSGQSIFFPQGDLTILGAVSSGAEVIAGGSIHVHGALRGRAIAGATGSKAARIFCRRFEAELVAIDGCYLTADKFAPGLMGKGVQVRLANDAVLMSLLD